MTGADQQKLTATQRERCNGRGERRRNDVCLMEWRRSREQNAVFSGRGIVVPHGTFYISSRQVAYVTGGRPCRMYSSVVGVAYLSEPGASRVPVEPHPRKIIAARCGAGRRDGLLFANSRSDRYEYPTSTSGRRWCRSFLIQTSESKERPCSVPPGVSAPTLGIGLSRRMINRCRYPMVTSRSEGL